MTYSLIFRKYRYNNLGKTNNVCTHRKDTE